MIKLFIYISGFILFIYPQENNLRFIHISSNEGLSQSNVRSILQDKKGFLWFGTADGLNKFDGSEFTVYKPNYIDSVYVIGNNFSSLFEDSKGIIWLGTERGIGYYERKIDKFYSFLDTAKYPKAVCLGEIGAIVEDENTNLWLATNFGLIFYDRRSKKFKQISHTPLETVFIDSRKNIWLGTSYDGLQLLDKKTYKTTRYYIKPKDTPEIKNYEVRVIKEDTDGFLWVGTYGYGLAKFNLNDSSKQMSVIYMHDMKDDNSIGGNLVLSLLLEEEGVWVGLDNGGISYLTKKSNRFIRYINNPNDAFSINNNSIYSILKDNAGDLWFGTYSGGVNYLNRANQVFKYFRNIPGNSKSLSSNVVRDFAEEKSGNIWIATDGGGLEYFDISKNEFIHHSTANTNIINNAVLTVFIDTKDNIWIGNWDGGLSLFNKQNKSFTAYTPENSAITSRNIFDIDEDKNGNLWLASTNGIIKFDPKTKQFEDYSTNNSEILNSHNEVVLVDSKGFILAGTSDGLSIIDPVTHKIKNYKADVNKKNLLSAGFVMSIYEESPSVLWIGTSLGMNRLNRETGKIERFFENDGLPHNSIRSIVADDYGNLWITTTKGISKFNIKNRTFKNYTKSDGIQGNEYIINSLYKTSNGKILFGGVDGFDYFDPKEVVYNKFIPPVEITDFKIFNESVIPGKKGSVLTVGAGETTEITLSYQQSFFSFEFAALNFRVADRNQYAYMLKGFDAGWNYIGNRRTATYTNLDPGKYEFVVKAANNDEVWNEEGKSIKIIITPPFWQTWWFITIVVLILAAIIYILIVDKIQKNEIKLLQKSEKLKSEFFAQMSHEIRSPINVIFSYLSIIESEYNSLSEEELKSFFASIHSSGTRIIRTIELLLNMSEVQSHTYNYQPKEMDLEEEVLTPIFKEYLALAKGKNLDLTITKENQIPKLFLDEYTIKQIFSNLVDNAIKYTKKGSIEIVYGMNEHMYVKIIDTGIGIKAEYMKSIFEPFTQEDHGYTRKYEGNGLGLALVKRYCELNDAQINVKSEKEKGSTFEVIINKSRIV